MRKAIAALILSLYLLASAIPGNSPSPSPKAFSSAPLGSTDYPWTMLHHDSLRLGASPAIAPGTANLMWTYTTGAQVYSSPAVTEGIVFIPSWDGALYAIDEYSGGLRWSFNTGASIFSSPAVANGIVYAASTNGVIYALNGQSGGAIWTRGTLNYPITSSPVVADGKVFYGNWCRQSLCNPPGQFVALDAGTGAVMWTNATVPNAPVISSPSVHNGRVFFGENDGSVVALNETNGALLWSAQPSGNVVIRSAPAVAYGRVYVGTDNRFAALNELTGAVSWTFNTNNSNSTSGAVNNGAVYFGTGRGNVYAVNATTGLQIWSSPTGAGVSSSPALSLGSKMVLSGSNDQYLYALNMTTGARLWRYPTGGAIWSSPAVADGRVFFGSDDFKVYALGAKIPQLQVSISASLGTLKPGEVSTLVVTVTNGTSPVSGATLVLSSSAASGGFSLPVEQSPGSYQSNYTAPLVNSAVTITIQATASKTGLLDGSATTSITINPFPPLKVYVTPRPAAISPGGDILLSIVVMNGSQPIAGAAIFLTSTAGGSFSPPIYEGGGNYTAIYSAALQTSSPTVVVQATKEGFSPGTAQVTITVGGVPDLLGVKLYGLPLLLIVAALFFLVFIILVGLLARRREADLSPPYRPNSTTYAFGGDDSREGLSNRFWAGLAMGLAAIAGS